MNGHDADTHDNIGLEINAQALEARTKPTIRTGKRLAAPITKRRGRPRKVDTSCTEKVVTKIQTQIQQGCNKQYDNSGKDFECEKTWTVWKLVGMQCQSERKVHSCMGKSLRKVN